MFLKKPNFLRYSTRVFQTSSGVVEKSDLPKETTKNKQTKNKKTVLEDKPISKKRVVLSDTELESDGTERKVRVINKFVETKINWHLSQYFITPLHILYYNKCTLRNKSIF